MLAQFGAIFAAVHSAAGKFSTFRFRVRFRVVLAGLAIGAIALGGCSQTTAPLASADPADPGAKVAPVGYRSTIAPYTSLRPTAPSSWRELNERVAPASKSGR